MGTHPIFESDFDCLTDCRTMNWTLEDFCTCSHHYGQIFADRMRDEDPDYYTDQSSFIESDYSSSFDDQEILDLDQMLNATDNDKNIRFEWGDAIKVYTAYF